MPSIKASSPLNPNINKMTSIAVGASGNGLSGYGSTNQASRRQILNYISYVSFSVTASNPSFIHTKRHITTLHLKSLHILKRVNLHQEVLNISSKESFSGSLIYILAPTPSNITRTLPVRVVTVDVSRPSTRQALRPQSDTRHIYKVDFRTHRIINRVPYYYGVSTTIYTDNNTPIIPSSSMSVVKNSSYPILPTILPPYLVRVNMMTSLNLIINLPSKHRVILPSELILNQVNITRVYIELM